MNLPPRLNFFRGTQFSWLMPLGWNILQAVAITAPITVEVFLHRNFGARTGKALVKGFLLLSIIYAFLNREPPLVFPLFPGYLFAYAVVAIGQWLSSRLQEPNGQIHSYSNGEPWALWQQTPFTRPTVQGFCEPLLCFVFSGVISLFDSQLAIWIFVAAIALFVKEQLFRAQSRTRRLNAFDNRAETNDYAPRTRPETETFVEARPAPLRPPRQHR
ncbi:MAG: hypothetical protein ABI042_18385 [Verrucomicrobiota bacterium]